jgi:hypothetical protein
MSEQGKATMRANVYEAIDREREYQDARWGGVPHDARESVGNFLIYMERYLQKAKDAYVDASHSTEALREIRKVAALAVACMEVHGAPRR